MSHLVPCSECQRHVRASEAECPFCGSALAWAALPPRAVPYNVRRAALLVMGAALAVAPLGCGEDEGGGGSADASADGQSGTGGGSGATGGGAGSGGSSATGGTSGNGGTSGSGGASGSGGSAGDSGSAGSGGSAGTAGTAQGGFAGLAPPYGLPPD